MVEVESVHWLRQDHPDHPGKHESWEEVFDLTHTGFRESGGPVYEIALCRAYDRFLTEESCEPFTQDLATSVAEPAAARAVSAIEDPQVDMIDVHDLDLVPGATTVSLSYESATAPIVAVFSEDPSVVVPSLAGTDFTLEEYLGAPVWVATVADTAETELVLTSSAPLPLPVGVVVWGETNRTMELVLPGLVGSGESAAVGVTLTEPLDTDAPTLTIEAPSGTETAVVLSETDPGVWQATYHPTEAGLHTALAMQAAPGHRRATGGFNVSSGQATLTGQVTESAEVGAGGLIDVLLLGVEAEVDVEGDYRVALTLEAPSGQVVGAGGGVAHLTAGVGSIDVPVPGSDLYNSGVDGPFTIVDVLLSQDSPNRQIDDRVDVLGHTGPHLAADFAHFPVEFDLGGFEDQGVDVDGNGLFDTLTVTGTVRVDTAGAYAVNAFLRAPDRTELGQFQSVMNLVEGTNELTLAFDGRSIGEAGIDGPYTVADLSVYPTSGRDELGFLITAHLTGAYSAAAFEGSNVLVAETRLSIGESATITSGGVAVTDGTGPSMAVTVGEGARFEDASSTVTGHRVRIERGAVVQNVAYNILINRGTVVGNTTSPLELPLGAAPEPPGHIPGETDVDVEPGDTVALVPGSYGRLSIGAGGRAELADGTYHFAEIHVAAGGGVVADGIGAGTTVVVDGRVSMAAESRLERPGGQLTVWGLAADSTAGPAFTVGDEATITAHIRAPSGSLVLGDHSQLTGSASAHAVATGNGVILGTRP